MKGITVASMFDGMSCIQIALNRLNIKVDKCYASEIDPYAISVTQYNYPDTIQLGDIREIKGKDLGHIDLIVGGSPCQGFSFSGHRLNFDDPRSKLFFEFHRVLNELKEINPDIYFLLENVRMSNKSKNIISKYMGTDSIQIDSALVSGQRRNRLYWTNIPNVTQPQDRGIMLKDILEDNAAADKYYLKQNQKDHVLDSTRLKKKYTAIGGNKALTLIGSYPRLNGTHIVDDKYYLSKKMKDYIMADKYNNKQEINTDKAKCLTASYHKMQRSNMASYVSTEHQPLDKTNIRKLTPNECLRLQTVEDNYTAKGIRDGKVVDISDTQQYKMIGNGWTVEVIVEILKNIIGNPAPRKLKEQTDQLQLFK